MACPDDARIVAFAHGGLDVAERRALREHLDACPECAGLVAEAVRCIDPVDATSDAAPIDLAQPVAAEPPPRHGTAVGRYLLLHLLGTGGLGQVWAAYDPELDRRVALKLIRPQARARLSADELRARLVREAQSLARVRDPNVVAVHDAGRFGEQVFIAMELVEGPTLDAWLKQRAAKWDVVRDAFVQAGRGLAAVHAAGLVHRDFKPSNVLVDADGRVRVADFGLARAEQITPVPATPVAIGASPPDTSGITASGLVVGTPSYMAPEQHAAQPVDARADQFAFCVAFFEALYGHRPFSGATAAALRDAILAGRIERPAVPSAAPAWLHRAILRGLAREPNDRYASMHALIDAITRDRALRRRGGLGLALALGLGGLAIGLGFRSSSPTVEASANDRVQELVDATHRAAARAHFVYPPPDDPSARTAFVGVLALEALEGDDAEAASRAAAELRAELAGTLVRLGDTYWDRDGGRIFALDYYAEALVFDPDHARARERAMLTPAQHASLVARAASLSFTESELAGAAPLAALAIEPEDDRTRAVARMRAGRQLSATTEAALDRLVPAAQPEPERGRVAAKASEASDREPIAASTIARRERNGRRSSASDPPPSPEGEATAEASRDPAAAAKEAARGTAALRRGDLDAAEVAFHSALRSDRRNVDALAGLGEVAFQRRAYKAAARYLERAVAVAPTRASLRLELGDVYYNVLRYEDALREYEEAQRRGSSTAGERLARLRDKLGEEKAR